MPFSGPNDAGLPSNVKEAPLQRRRQWVAVVNQCLADGGSDGECFRKANGVAMAELKTRDFLSVSIAQTGEYEAATGPITITRGRLDDMVEAARANPDFQAPIKLGHNKDQDLLEKDGLPSAGWVQNLRRIGDTLVADLMDIPQKIANLMEIGGLRKRSLEAAFDFEVGGKTWPMVLIGLALLGEEIPAIKTLDDITALYAKQGLKMDKKVVFSLGDLGHLSADYIRVLPDLAFASKTEGGTLRQLPHHTIKGAVDRLQVIRSVEDVVNLRASVALQRRMLSHLSDHANREGMDLTNEISEVSEALMEKELRELLGLGESGDILDTIKGLITLSTDLRKVLEIGDDADIGEAITALKAAKPADGPKDSPSDDDDPSKTGNESASLKAIRSDLSAAQGQILVLQGDAGRTEAATVVDKAIEEGQLLPAQRDVALKMAIGNRVDFDAFIENQPKNLVEMGERGANDGNTTSVDMATIEPTAEQKTTAEQMGLWSPQHRITLMRANAATKGITLPDDFGQEKKEEAKA